MKMAKYYGIKNPNSWQLRYDMNSGQVEIYETEEYAEKAARLAIGEVVEVFVTKSDLSEPLRQIRDRIRAGDLDEWSLQALEQLCTDAIGE